MEKLKIGDLKFDNRLFLSPMVDVTDLAYRLICRWVGASMAYTEMLQAEALINAREKKVLKSKMITCPKDKPLGIQITGRRISEEIIILQN